MELSEELKALYRHWPLHTAEHRLECAVSPGICAFVDERICMWERKQSGAPPYSDDPVLASFRFCNVFREFDRQTIEFHGMLNSIRSDFPRWLLNMFYCRMVARPETIRHTGLLSFDRVENEAVKERLLALPRPRYGTPYVFPISVIQRSGTPTRESFIEDYLPRVMPRIAHMVEAWKSKSIYQGVNEILPTFGFNLSFLWTEVLIDAAYQYPERIDLYGRFPVGPGALPTLRLLNLDINPSILVEQLGATGVTTNVTYEGKPLRLSAENWEGIACEYRKYTNLKAGSGRRRIYRSK